MSRSWSAARGPIVLAAVLALTGCAVTGPVKADRPPPPNVDGGAPERFRIVPDDYHVPYAGTAGDGRRFFLSEELFGYTSDAGYVGLFLWNADGTFDEIKVDAVRRPDGVPPGQAVPADSGELVEKRLAELGDYRLEPVDVAPFTTEHDGETFGWQVGQYDDGTYFVNVEPGNFIAYYEPWDGVDYDT